MLKEESTREEMEEGENPWLVIIVIDQEILSLFNTRLRI